MPIVKVNDVLPKTATVAENEANEAMRARQLALRSVNENLFATVLSARTAGAAIVYGNGLDSARAFFASQNGGGAKVVVCDLLLRQLAAIYNPTSPAAASPVPAGVDLQVGGADVVAFMANLETLVTGFLAAAGGVELNEPNP